MICSTWRQQSAGVCDSPGANVARMNRHQLELTGQSNSPSYRARTLVLTARRASTGAVHYARDRTIKSKNEACISGRYRTRGEGPRQYL